MSNNSFTFKLFRKTPNFINGMSSTLDFFGDDTTNYKIKQTEEEADTDAIYSDWQAVGNDMSQAMKKYGAEISQRKS